jgi:hypothetical protein
MSHFIASPQVVAPPYRSDIAAPAPLGVLLASPAPALRQSWLRQLWRLHGSLWEWLFGAFALVFGLAILSALPIVQFLSLGYLLESGGRVARTGRLRDAFVGVRKAARVGSIVLGCTICMLPVWFLLIPQAEAAQLIDPAGPVARGWRVGLLVADVLLSMHLVTACALGGRLRWFFLPVVAELFLVFRVLRGGYYVRARDAVWDFVTGLRLPYYFWLGIRGFVGAFAWLVLPVTLIAMGRHAPPIGFLGAFLLMVVLLYLPFLQARFAAQNRLRAFCEIRAVRADFQRAPFAFLVALLLTLSLALPLYLLKIEMVPRDAAWLESLVFLVFIFPARVATGWALGRARKRAKPRHWLFRGIAWLPTLPAVAFYVVVVFFTQYLAWGGIGSLYEQHPFLLPVSFFALPG